jgi:hypothetical protein
MAAGTLLVAGSGSNLYRLGVSDMVIQRILRPANVSTTATYYIRTAADDVRSAMAKLESQITVGSSGLSDTNGTLTERHLRRTLFNNLLYAAE